MLFEAQVKSLRFAVRPMVVVRYVAQMLSLVAIASLMPLGVMLVVGDVVPALLMGLCIGAMGLLALIKPKHQTKDLQHNEALVISASLIIIPALVFSIPMSGYGLAPADALFESVSGITSTGLTVLEQLEQRSPGLLFLRAWSQWLGGLGIVILFLGIILEPSLATRQLGLSADLRQDPLGGIRTHAKQAILTYALLTAAAVLSLWLSGLSFWQAILYGLTSVSTAGFTPTDNSLGAINPLATAMVFLFCILGAIPFHVYYRSVQLNWRIFFRDLQVRALLITLIISVVLVLSLNQWPAELSFTDRLSQAASLGVSAQTTSGFSNDITPEALSDTGKLALVAPMLVGGGLGSTAGGIKLLRLLLVLRVLELVLIRLSVPPHARIEARLGGQSLTSGELQSGIVILLGTLIVTSVSTLIFIASGFDPISSLFDVTSAMGTVGLSAGMVGPELPTPLKILLCGNMLLGRLETIAIIALLFPWTWIGRRRETL